MDRYVNDHGVGRVMHEVRLSKLCYRDWQSGPLALSWQINGRPLRPWAGP